MLLNYFSSKGLKGLKSPSKDHWEVISEKGVVLSKERRSLPTAYRFYILRAKSNSRTSDKYSQESDIN